VYPPPRGLLAGKTVLVTAAAGTGIGSALARRCLEEGATLAISDVHERRLAQAVDALSAYGPRPLSFLCDVTNEDQVRAMVAGTVAGLGHIDVLMNNAGLGGYAPLATMTDDAWSRVLDVTLTGTMRCTRAVMPGMLARGSGAIVNNASVLGWRAQEGQSHYAAAKAGVMAFTRCVAMEVARSGVRVNAVAPSLASHPFLAKVTPAGLLEKLTEQEAMGRGAEPWEVANVMVFLASDLSSYMTGEVLAVSSQQP
jgi:3-oxoacyl-[acyl-carrier protein] reductase